MKPNDLSIRTPMTSRSLLNTTFFLDRPVVDGPRKPRSLLTLQNVIVDEFEDGRKAASIEERLPPWQMLA